MRGEPTMTVGVTKRRQPKGDQTTATKSSTTSAGADGIYYAEPSTNGHLKKEEATSSAASTMMPSNLRRSSSSSLYDNMNREWNATTFSLATEQEQRQQQRHRRLNLEDAENDNYWSTSLYSKPPVLTSARCVNALREFFSKPALLAVATESSSHPTGLQSVLSQPWVYAGGGLGNIEECPLQVCLAGAGTRRDSITFGSVCVPFECHAQDLAADDFPASLELAAESVLALTNNPDDDDDPFEYQNHPERVHHHTTKNDKAWFHTPPEEQRAWAIEYITLQKRIAKLNDFLQTGWTCGNYHVPFEPFPFGVPFLFACGVFILLTLWATCGNSSSNSMNNNNSKTSSATNQRRQQKQQNEKKQQQHLLLGKSHEETKTTVLIDTEEPIFQQNNNRLKCRTDSLATTVYPTTQEDTHSLASLSSDCSPSDLSPESTPNHHDGTEDRQRASVMQLLSAGTTTTTASPTSLNHGGGNEARDAPLPPSSGQQSIKENQQSSSLSSSVPTPPVTIVECWNASYHWYKLCTARHEATACLDGLRVLSILWVILGHVMAIQSSTGGGYSNPIDFLPPTGMTTTLPGQIIFASRFAVDTFLLISGYLLVVVITRKAPTLLLGQVQEEERRGCGGGVGCGSKAIGTFFRLIGLRLVRILPLYLLCLGFYTQVAPHLYIVGSENDGGGPFWYQWDSLLQPCRDYGWTNLLFINNFIPWEKSNTETCFYHSWYLAVDMQLFVFVGLPVTFFIFLRNPVWGKRTTIALWWTSVLLTTYLSYVRHWSINTFDGVQVGRFDVEAYAKPHVRGQAYFAGMYVAMLQLTKKKEEERTQTTPASTERTWQHRVLLWGAILALGFVTFCTVTGAYARRPCQYGEAPISSDCGSLWKQSTTFLYTATSRAIWSCSIGILMTLCLEGKGGWLGRFLSWPIWAPFAQLSFGVYLIHPIVIFVWLLGMRQKNVYSLATFAMSLISVCCVSFAWALVASVLVEFPIATLIANQIKKHTQQQRRLPGSNAFSTSRATGYDEETKEESSELMGALRPTEGGYGSVGQKM